MRNFHSARTIGFVPNNTSPLLFSGNGRTSEKDELEAAYELILRSYSRILNFWKKTDQRQLINWKSLSHAFPIDRLLIEKIIQRTTYLDPQCNPGLIFNLRIEVVCKPYLFGTLKRLPYQSHRRFQMRDQFVRDGKTPDCFCRKNAGNESPRRSLSLSGHVDISGNRLGNFAALSRSRGFRRGMWDMDGQPPADLGCDFVPLPFS